MSHLGPRVSDLLDGRLSPDEEERCWEHVHQCHECRDLVEREAWLKHRLAGLGRDEQCASADFKSALCRPGGLSGPTVFAAGPRMRTRSLAAIGGGALSACVVGVLALGAAPAARVDPRPPVTDLSRPSAPMMSGLTTADARRRTTTTERTTSPLSARLVALREKMVP